jgi:phage repressor protein C with HTH and peptisase S24 domain
MHTQDQPADVSSLFLQPGALRSAALPPGCMLMRVTTNDMAGYVGVGDMVIYNPGVKWISSGNDVYLFRVGNQYVLRRATRSLRGDITLTSDSTGATESFKGEDFTSEAKDASGALFVVGRVVARILMRG